MKPEQPRPETYNPQRTSNVEFQCKWKTVRVNRNNIESNNFAFRLDLDASDRYSIRFLEFRAFCDPPSPSPPDLGNPGDTWLNVSLDAYALFTLTASRQWSRWPGPTLDHTQMIMHPHIPLYALWCTVKQASWYHRDKLAKDWAGAKLAARQQLGGYVSVASMLDASVGIRLIVLWEEAENRKSITEPAPTSPSQDALGPLLGTEGVLPLAQDSVMSDTLDATREGPPTSPASVQDTLISTLDPAITIDTTKDALIGTLSLGINHLLVERTKMSQALLDAERRVARAERTLATSNLNTNRTSGVPQNQTKPSRDPRRRTSAVVQSAPAKSTTHQLTSSEASNVNKYYPDRSVASNVSTASTTSLFVASPTDTPSTSPPPSSGGATNALSKGLRRSTFQEHLAPSPIKRRKLQPPDGSSSSATLPSQLVSHRVENAAPIIASPEVVAPTPPRISFKHLDIIFRPTQDGRAKHCRICLTLVTYGPFQELATLMAHAEKEHPTECAVFAVVSDAELAEGRRQLEETDRESASMA